MSNADDNAPKPATSVNDWIAAEVQTGADHREFARAYIDISIRTPDAVLRSRMRNAAATSLKLARAAEKRAREHADALKAGHWSAGAIIITNN
jgi:hypothetical protein